MQPVQFAAIYRHLEEKSKSMPAHKLHGLASMHAVDPVSGVLYLPLYSLGMAAHGMDGRIDYLKKRAGGHDLQFFATSPLEALEALEALCDEHYKNNVRFGDFFIRLYEIRKRAKHILEIGESSFRQKLKPPSEFPSEQEFKTALKFLTKFRGISETSAQHVLMDLGWPIVKPDRHIQRILYRLGGWNDFFDSEVGDKKLTSKEWYKFQKQWTDAVRLITSQLSTAAGFCELSSRKIDICLMWYSQTQKRDDPSLSPPVCTVDPACALCQVPDCMLRRPQ